MQKKLIALAIAGLVSAPAFAQSNVTIYGVADAAIGIGEHGDNDFQGVVNGILSGSRIGFRGTEDLGNGLKAVFTLEQGFNIDNGNSSSSRAFHRQAFVGVAGGLGGWAISGKDPARWAVRPNALWSVSVSTHPEATHHLAVRSPNSVAHPLTRTGSDHRRALDDGWEGEHGTLRDCGH